MIVTNGSGLGLLGGAIVFPPDNAVELVDTSNPATTDNVITRFDLPNAPMGIAIASGIGYIADGTGGLQVINYVGFDTQGKAPTVSITGPRRG